MSFDDLLNAALVIRHNVAVTSGGAETAGGLDTTLAADVAAGATVLIVPDAASIAPGSLLRLGDVGEREVLEVASATDELDAEDVLLYSIITTVAPVLWPHDSGDQVREVDATGPETKDENGYTVTAPITVATVDGRIRPLTAREVQTFNQGGAVVSTLACDLYPVVGLDTACWIECGGGRYDINSMPDAAGQGHHLVLGVTRVS
jgi:hypothetical protein